MNRLLFVVLSMLMFGGLACGEEAAPVVIAKRGDPVPQAVLEKHDWQEAVMTLMKHRCRGVVWQFQYYPHRPPWTLVGFEPQDEKEAEEVLALFGKTDGDYHYLQVAVTKGLPEAGHHPPLAVGCPMVLKIDSLKLLNEFVAGLPKNKEGQPVNGDTVIDEPMLASVPRLMIFAGHENIDFATLPWPEWSVVSSAVSREDREVHAEDPLLGQIDRLAKEHSYSRCAEQRRRRLSEKENEGP